MAKLSDLVVTIGATTRDFDKALNSSIRKLQRFGMTTKRIGKSLTTSVSAPIVGMGLAAVKAAADLEQMETAFVSLTGGAKEASQMMQQLNKFAASTPFQIEAIADSARQLLASGSSVEQVQGQLQFLGDIAATSGKPIEELAAIYAKVNAKGKVELESLNQLAERGIPIFTQLSEATGLPASELGAGAVSVEQFNSTLRAMAADGGFASGAMLRLSQTASGKFSTALDNLKQAGAAMAQSLLPIVNKMLDKFTAFAQKVAALSAEKKELILQIAAFAAALGPVLVMLPYLVQGFMALLSPAGLVIAAIAAIVGALFYFRNEVAQPIADVINFFITLYNEVDFLRGIVGFLKGAFISVFTIVNAYTQGIINLFKNLGKVIIALVTGDFSAIPEIITGALDEAKNLFFDTGKQVAENIVGGINSELQRAPIELVTADQVAGALTIPSFLGGGGAGAERPEALQAMKPITLSQTAPVAALQGTEEIAKRAEASSAAYEKALAKMEEANAAFESSIQGISGKLQGTFEGLIQGLLEGTTNFGDFFKQLLKDLMIKVAALVATFAILSVLFPGSNLVMGGFGKFLGGNLGLSGLIPMASGGIVSGPTPILAGEYSGAKSNPEVIAPLDKLQSLLGNTGNKVEVVGKISGRDILLASERSNSERTRSRGF